MYFLRAIRPLTISTICGCSSGSPPGIDTIGAPHSSTALKHSSGERSVLRMWAGYWTFPHPAQARLQRNKGSSMSTSGYFFLPMTFCLSTYVATVQACETGTAIWCLLHQKSLRNPRALAKTSLRCGCCYGCFLVHCALVRRQGQKREIIAVEMICEIKDSRETCSGVDCFVVASRGGLIPCADFALLLH